MSNLAGIERTFGSAPIQNVPVLKVNNLRKSYGAINAVDGLDFEVPAGSIIGMIGPNGCGKTTTINCITGFDDNFSGDVEVEGLSTVGLNAENVARTGVMRTFQAIRVFDQFTTLRNAMIGMQCFDGLHVWDPILRTRRYRQSEEQSSEKAVDLLRTVGLGAKIDDLAGNLSYGQKKLLALASILMSEPKIVILDEPVAGVNPTLTHEIADTLKELNRTGTTFLIIEHNIEFIMNISDGVIVMDRGRRLASGTPQEIRKDERVLEAYLGGSANA